MTLHYNTDITYWEEHSPPPRSERFAYELWFGTANFCKVSWHVFVQQGKVHACLTTETQTETPRPQFATKQSLIGSGTSFLQVEDGWLVGYNKGEWGGALYWFSFDGEENYKISRDQIVEFLETETGLVAVQGLAHLTSSRGSLIQIVRNAHQRWEAKLLSQLPAAPNAVVRLSDAKLLVVLTNALITLDQQYQQDELVSEPKWSSLYTTSAVLSENTQKLYIGMRQFVVEFEFSSRQLRYLLPNKSFLHVLTPKFKAEMSQMISNRLRL